MFLASIRDIKGQGNSAIYVRGRDATGNFWDFVGLAWVTPETADCRVFLNEFDDADITEARYQVSITLPAPLVAGVLEYVRFSDSRVLGEESISLGGPSALAIASAVWDEPSASHVIAGSFGALVGGITTVLSQLAAILARLTSSSSSSLSSSTSTSSTTSKDALGSLYPQGAVASGWGRLEPLITPQKLKDLHLFGLSVMSGMRDPITNKALLMSDAIIEEKILDAVALAEVESGLNIFPTQFQQKLPFDKAEFASLGFFMLRERPVSSIQRLSVTPADGVEVFRIPNGWIETAYLHRGQINIIPINVAQIGGTFSPVSINSAGGAWFLSVLGSRNWLPAFWEVVFVSGFPDGQIPRLVNQLVGTIAAMEILSELAATYAKSTSHSLGIDSISQSISTPGPQLFMQRIQELGDKKKMLIGKLKAMFGLKIFSQNV